MTLPSAVLDLSVWKLTLPTGSKGSPTEVSGKALLTFSDPNWFHATPDGKAVVFRAPVNGVTTSGSKNPRSELREMTASGKPASWTGKTGWHVLSFVLAFTHLPNARTDGGNAGVVGGQIHSASDDVTVWRLEGNKLYVTSGNNTHFKLVDSNYVLGAPVLVQYVVWAGKIQALYNGKLVATLDATKLKGLYGKIGCYTQANCSNSKPCAASNYGETLVYYASVTHADRPGTIPTPPLPGAVPAPTPVPIPTPAPVPAPAAQDVVIVLRHGEKPSDSSSHILSPVGFQRAQALAALFTADPLRQGLLRPDRIYASKGATPSMRPLQTVQPLAAKLGLGINATYDAENAESAMGKELAGLHGVTLVSLEHSAIVGVCRALGKISPKTPSEWSDSRFDVFWIFRRQADGSWGFRQFPQMLLPGDLSKGI